MTLDEVRKVLGSATWTTHEAPLVALLDEIIERHDARTINANSTGKYSGAITQAFTVYKRGQVASGRVVQLLIGLRQRYKMPLYALQG